MEILLALFIKVVETVVVVMTKDLLNHFKKQRKNHPYADKRNQGGSKSKN